MGFQVKAPDGSMWKVGRHWAPRIGTETVWGRLTRRFRRTTDVADAVDAEGLLALPDEGVGAAIGALVVVAVVVLLAAPLLLAVVDVVIVLLVAVVGVTSRVLLRRPWTVGARRLDGKGSAEWRVSGWRASGALADDVARRLQAGQPLPPHGPAHLI